MRGIITQLWHPCLALRISKCEKSTVIKLSSVALAISSRDEI